MIGFRMKNCNLAVDISQDRGFMLRFIVFVFFLFLPSFLLLSDKPVDGNVNSSESVTASDVEAYADLYRSMQLEGIVNWKAFCQAVTGYYKINRRQRDVLTLIDFSRPSTVKRLFVFDMKQRKMLFSSVVSHGRNSGGNYATSFSNEYGSYKSSLGFYLTESTYQGRNGYSLILNGLEKGINDRARDRAIVMHGASYANPSVVNKDGRLGRSFGCPAVPQALCRPIIDAIKGGSVMYIYAVTPDYLAHSSVLKDTSVLSSYPALAK